MSMGESIHNGEDRLKGYMEDPASLLGNKKVWENVELTKGDVELFLSFFGVLIQSVSNVAQYCQEMSKEALSQDGKTLDAYREELRAAKSFEEKKYWRDAIDKTHDRVDVKVESKSSRVDLKKLGYAFAGGVLLLMLARSNNNKAVTGL
jgi:hypothetical protein